MRSHVIALTTSCALGLGTACAPTEAPVTERVNLSLAIENGTSINGTSLNGASFQSSGLRAVAVRILESLHTLAGEFPVWRPPADPVFNP